MTIKKKDKATYWFPAMKHGVGWGLPVTPQGWSVFLAYIALMISGGLFFSRTAVVFAFFPLYALLLTGLLIWVCVKKGEKKPRDKR